METICPNCQIGIEIEAETLQSLQNLTHFECPACAGAVGVPNMRVQQAVVPLLARRPVAPPVGKKAASRQLSKVARTGPGKPAPRLRKTIHTGHSQGLNRNLRILGTITLLTLGGVGIFITSRKSGNTVKTTQNIINETIHNKFFSDLIASGATTEKELLASLADLRPYGTGFIGVSSEKFTALQAPELAKRTGSKIVTLDEPGAASRQPLLDWLTTVYPDLLGSTTWIMEGNEAKVIDSPDVNRVTTMDRPRKVILGWPAASSGVTSATKEKPFVNSLGLKFVPVPGTKVLFCIHETRRQDYAVYAAEVAGVNMSWKDQQFKGIPVGGEDDHPVVSVNWEDAQSFCGWLSKKERKTYRLPTDREWSFAVGMGKDEPEGELPRNLRGLISNHYPWGNEFPPVNKVANLGDTTFHDAFPEVTCILGYTDGFPTTAPVMGFLPNVLGICDLGGNVTEWCEESLNEAESDQRIIRGGNWGDSNTFYLASSNRLSYPKTGRYFGYGFRIVVEAH